MATSSPVATADATGIVNPKLGTLELGSIIGANIVTLLGIIVAVVCTLSRIRGERTREREVPWDSSRNGQGLLSLYPQVACGPESMSMLFAAFRRDFLVNELVHKAADGHS
jgi:Ca2+/Na+ antiporter